MYLNYTEKRYTNKELQLLGVAKALEHFRYFVLKTGKKILTIHQSKLQKNRAHKTDRARITIWIDPTGSLFDQQTNTATVGSFIAGESD